MFRKTASAQSLSLWAFFVCGCARPTNDSNFGFVTSTDVSLFGFLFRNARWLSGGFLLALCSSFGQTFFVSLFNEDIRDHFELTNGQFGMIYMSATLVSAAVFYKLGSVVDRFSIPVVASCVLLALAAACAGMRISDSVWLLALSLFSLRLFGQGMLLHTSQTAIGRWFEAKRGSAISITSMGLNTGEAIFPKLVIVLSAWFAWQTLWTGAAIFAVAAVPVCIALTRVPRKPVASGGKAKYLSSRKQWTRPEVLRDKLFWLASPGVFAPAFIATAIFFHHQHLAEIKEWPGDTFATGFVFLSISTVAAKLFAGPLIDRFGAIRLMWIYHIPLGVSCAAFWLMHPSWIVYPGMSLIGISMGFANSIFGALWPEAYGTKHLGSVRSIAVSGVVFASACGSGLTGLLIDENIGFEIQLAMMAAWCLLSAISLKLVSAELLNRITRSNRDQPPAET